MYKTYWSMTFNPFDKGIKTTHYFQSNDFAEATKRLEHLKNIKGIGLFTGLAGTGKTSSLKAFVTALNPSLYKVVYLQLTTISTNEFYKALSMELGLEPKYRKIDNYRQIQQRIITLYKDQKITLLIWIDEAQYLSHAILAGQPILTNTLSMQIHEPLKQRIVINYSFQGLKIEEVKNYIISRLEVAGVYHKILEDNALEAAAGCCNGSIRKLNNLMHKALMIGCNLKAPMITTDIIMAAHHEIELI